MRAKGRGVWLTLSNGMQSVTRRARTAPVKPPERLGFQSYATLALHCVSSTPSGTSPPQPVGMTSMFVIVLRWVTQSITAAGRKNSTSSGSGSGMQNRRQLRLVYWRRLMSMFFATSTRVCPLPRGRRTRPGSSGCMAARLATRSLRPDTLPAGSLPVLVLAAPVVPAVRSAEPLRPLQLEVTCLPAAGRNGRSPATRRTRRSSEKFSPLSPFSPHSSPRRRRRARSVLRAACAHSALSAASLLADQPAGWLIAPLATLQRTNLENSHIWNKMERCRLWRHRLGYSSTAYALQQPGKYRIHH